MNLQERAHRIWYGRGLADRAARTMLLPLEALYGTGVRVRNAAFRTGALPRKRAALPVLSVGNVAVGGTGKTPVSHWFARQLAGMDHRPAILHGGYAEDEPALHRWWWPGLIVVAGSDRAAVAAKAGAQGATVLVMDDGFQHRHLHRDADVVLVAAERWDPRARLLPRGPLREPLAALRRADLVVVTRKSATAAEAAAIATDIRERWGVETSVMHLRPAGLRRARPDRPAGTGGADPATPLERGENVGPVLLVSGLAEPASFEVTAKTMGADVAYHLRYPDHHAYTAADANRILAEAGGRPVLTTEKDWMKLRQFLDPERVLLLAQEVVVEDGDAATRRLLAAFRPEGT